jgi:serine/threonine protein kinase
MDEPKPTENASMQALRVISEAWANSTLPLVATAEALLRGEEVALPSIEDRYIEGAEIGRGGLGRVSSVYDKRLGRQVALKEKLKGGHRADARFFQEALITAQLEHPSIIPVYDFGRKTDGTICYAMKLVSGNTLTEAITKKPLLATRLPLLPNVLAVCEAVAYAHSKKIIHRDLKPHNILVGDFGETILIDWGIAKSVGSKDWQTEEAQSKPSLEANLTQQGSVLGTPAYMPLEQAQGKEVDERADVYSLGAILYHLLSGKPPYQAKNGVEVLKLLLAGPPPSLEIVAPLAPRDLQSIINKAMERDPRDRYETAKELVQDLKSFLAGQMVVARRYSLTERFYRILQKNRLTVLLWTVLLAGFLGVMTAIYSVVVTYEELQNCQQQLGKEKSKE